MLFDPLPDLFGMVETVELHRGGVDGLFEEFDEAVKSEVGFAGRCPRWSVSTRRYEGAHGSYQSFPPRHPISDSSAPI
jgi:hypothetical protein